MAMFWNVQASMDHNFDFDITLLECVRETPVIWDPSDSLYLNRKIKSAAWEEMVQRMKEVFPLQCKNVTSGMKGK